MIILSYDITSDKTRMKFAKFLCKYGRRLQYSVFEIRNSQRVLQNILDEITYRYERQFTGSDSVVIFQLSETDKGKIRRYGYAANEERDVVVFS